MKEIILGSTVKELSTNTEFIIDKKVGVLYVLKALDGGRTVRRNSKLINEQFEIVVNTNKTNETVESKPTINIRVPREELDIKRHKKSVVNIEDVELKALQMLQEDVVETEEIVELSFDYDIGIKLKVPFQVLKMLPTTGRVNYMVQKLQSDDDWTKLLYYIWVNRKVLRRYSRFSNVEEIAISLLGKGDRPKELDFNRVKKELDKVISYSTETGLIDYELYANVVKALPDGHNTELSYYLYAITTDLFKSSEWGAVGLDRTLIAQIDKETEVALKSL